MAHTHPQQMWMHLKGTALKRLTYVNLDYNSNFTLAFYRRKSTETWGWTNTALQWIWKVWGETTGNNSDRLCDDVVIFRLYSASGLCAQKRLLRAQFHQPQTAKGNMMFRRQMCTVTWNGKSLLWKITLNHRQVHDKCLCRKESSHARLIKTSQNTMSPFKSSFTTGK